jgi:hypothetical protein|tara:strand:+ start:251 stop:382 length:132 start_codon:yes stop_codon:yes gene_type:complete
MSGGERLQQKRVDVEFWASLNHLLLGEVAGVIQDMSNGGIDDA